jgi:hypothetical protein
MSDNLKLIFRHTKLTSHPSYMKKEKKEKWKWNWIKRRKTQKNWAVHNEVDQLFILFIFSIFICMSPWYVYVLDFCSKRRVKNIIKSAIKNQNVTWNNFQTFFLPFGNPQLSRFLQAIELINFTIFFFLLFQLFFIFFSDRNFYTDIILIC